MDHPSTLADAQARIATLEAELSRVNETMSRCAHDLRGPVGNILGFVDLVLEHDERLDPEMALRRIQDNAQELIRRIEAAVNGDGKQA